MGFLDIFRSSTSSNGNGTKASIAIVDGDALVSERGDRGRTRPTDQLIALNWLADFASKEKISVTAVFCGRPLREVDKGGDFRGIKVHFADEPSKAIDTMLKLLRSTGPRRSIVVTSDTELRDRVLSAGADTMQPSTVRRAAESTLSRSLSGAQRRKRRPRRGGGDGGGGGRSQKPAASREDSSRESRILDFIDPI